MIPGIIISLVISNRPLNSIGTIRTIELTSSFSTFSMVTAGTDMLKSHGTTKQTTKPEKATEQEAEPEPTKTAKTTQHQQK